MNQAVGRALISVSDKRNIVGFAQYLVAQGVEILSTGGTAILLRENNIPVIEVSDYTGFPEMMDGRVKTLNPKIHGGILARRGLDDEVLRENSIPTIDLVVVNLYPFEETIAKPDCRLEDAIENIDIGGPTMLRAAAKNHCFVSVVVDSQDYQRVQSEMESCCGWISDELRFDLAAKAFEHTARYDSAIANYLGARLETNDQKSFSRTCNLNFEKRQQLRYGENPHQSAAFYVENGARAAGISTANQLQGKALSYNNIADTDAAIECAKQFSKLPACVIVKHANPCGVAEADTINEAYQKAYSTDPESAFGGIIAFNQALDGKTAQQISDQQFVEVIVAPEIDSEAKSILESKVNIRLLETGKPVESDEAVQPVLDYKRVSGGLLVQSIDDLLYEELKVVTTREPDKQQMDDLIFAWKVSKYVKSNAIIYAKSGMTIGVGAGQMSRVNSARIAAIKANHAGLPVQGAVMASDAFFPFRDGLDNAASVGIAAVIQPGGSMRDDEVIAAANEHDIAMVFTGMRHFRH